MKQEFILAGNALDAVDYAVAAGWKQPDPKNRRRFLRTDETGEPVEITYFQTADRLQDFAGHRLYIAPFRGGIPASTLGQIIASGMEVVGAVKDMQIANYKPMRDAPEDRAIMVYDAATEQWHQVKFDDGAKDERGHYTQWRDIESNWRLEYPVCWIDPPADPPQFLIDAARSK